MYRITIKTENAAFEGAALGPEAARILRRLADQIEADPYRDGRALIDMNGNTVGRCEIDPEEGGRS